jgi:hypothetical protein
VGEMRNAYIVYSGNLTSGAHLGDLCADNRIILKWIFIKQNVRYEFYLSVSGQGPVVGVCDHSN